MQGIAAAVARTFIENPDARDQTGFVAAINAAGANDARASALIGLFITGTISIGTAVVAPFLDHGLIAPALAAVVIIAPALVLAMAPMRGKRLAS